MTGSFPLDWAILAFSLFNTMLLLWLGLTVFLNAERRAWGIWLASGGLLLGAVFFISHSAIAGQGVLQASPGLNFWWHVGWIPVIILPFAWYVVMLWYCGHWEPPVQGPRRLPARRRPWFYLTLLAGLALVVLVLFFNPLPNFSQVVAYELAASPTLGGIPLLILVYPAYTLLCTGLSVDALRFPGPSARLLGEAARRRARRYLIATSLILLLVGLLAGWVMVWIARSAGEGATLRETILITGRYDLAIEILLAAAVLSLGQGVVTYEIFTGKALPRSGLLQHWRRAVILALGFSLLLAGSIALQLRPIYILLLSLALIVCFFALLGWRAFAERERLMRHLRPFVTHGSLVEGMLREGEGAAPAGLSPGEEGDRSGEPFYALCADILEARQACLVPYGALAPLTGGPLVYPPVVDGHQISLPDLDPLIPRLRDPDEHGVPLDPEDEGHGMVFAVSLWSERGLTGVLLLGSKLSGGLYTQEEIEIARAVGEQLMDTRASMEMSRRLIALQRQHLTQTRVLDQQTRRVLHDEVLPLVHTALLGLNGTGEQTAETGALLQEIHRQLSDLLRLAPGTAAVEVGRLGVLGALRHTIEVELQGAFDQVTFTVQPEGERELEKLPALSAEVLYFAAREAVRNAARHARGGDAGANLCLKVELAYRDGLLLAVEDNGAGMPPGDRPPGMGSPQERAEPGQAGSPEAGSGQGLALHSTMMAIIGGSLTIESAPGRYTRLTLHIPPQAT